MENGQRPKNTETIRSEAPERIPVPKYIRTERTKPRIFAALVAIAWIVLYVTGTAALERHYQSSQLITDYSLEVGEHFWLAKRSPDDEQCAGYLHATMELEPKPVAMVAGAMFLPIFQQDIPVNFEIRGEFSQVFLLERAKARLTAGALKIEAQTDGTEAKTAEVTISSQDTERQLRIPLPHPVYITETIPKHYSLRIPSGAREQIELLQSRFAAAQGTAAPVSKESDQEKIEVCRELLTESRPSTATYDLGSYLNILGVNKDLSVIKELGITNDD